MAHLRHEELSTLYPKLFTRCCAVGGTPVWLTVVSGSIGCQRQTDHESEERPRLPDEQPGVRQEPERTQRRPSCFGRANDRTDREFTVEEDGRLRHDQAGRKRFAAKRRDIEVWED